jgi:hypothetical protein
MVHEYAQERGSFVELGAWAVKGKDGGPFSTSTMKAQNRLRMDHRNKPERHREEIAAGP